MRKFEIDELFKSREGELVCVRSLARIKLKSEALAHALPGISERKGCTKALITCPVCVCVCECGRVLTLTRDRIAPLTRPYSPPWISIPSDLSAC